MRILVTNAKSRIAYNIIKSLAIQGHTVFCADFVPLSMSFYSRYSSGHFIYPSPFSRQEEFVSHLIKKIKILKIDVLIPVFEELFLVSRHSEEFSHHVQMALPRYDQIMIAHNKDKWASIAKSLNISIPKTYSFHEFIDRPELVNYLNFPIIVKPKQGGGGWGIAQLDTIDELIKLIHGGVHCELPLERFIVQEKIDGEVVCVAMVFSHGQLRGSVAYKVIREFPFFGGQATCRISVASEIAENSLRVLLEKIGWHGVCQADFIVERGTGRSYLIDVNPRFWGSLVQGIASGVNFPDLILKIALNGDVDPVVGFRHGVKTRWLGGEIRGFFQHYSHAESKVGFLKDFFISPLSAVQFDDFSFRDPFPFIVWGVDSFYRLVRNRSIRTHDSLSGVWD
jgi:predicted ATP-grasp superfamily ATP-dependent carboligase